MNVKEKITALRKEREWSKRRLAKEAGLTPSTIYNWYNERNNEPSKEAIEDICAAFNISMAEFFSDLEIDKLLHSAPNNWKTERGAYGWAKKHGYEVPKSVEKAPKAKSKAKGKPAKKKQK